METKVPRLRFRESGWDINKSKKKRPYEGARWGSGWILEGKGGGWGKMGGAIADGFEIDGADREGHTYIYI